MHRWSNDGGSTWSEPDQVMRLGAAFGGPNALTQDSSGAIYIVTAINEGVYSARWDGSMWGPPERIEDRDIDPHGQEIAICQGNKLQVIYDDRNDSQNIWYSSRTVDAPRLDRQPQTLPVPATGDGTSNISTIVATPVASDDGSPTAPIPIEFPNNADQSPANPLTPLLIASGFVIALILVIIVVKRR
jgi:hypothetical protein